jgi:hypothetical protein
MIAILLLTPAAAQAEDLLSDGARVRIRMGSGGKPLVGTIVAIESGTFTIDAQNMLETRVVPRSMVRKLEVSQGLKRKTMKGAWIGLATGTLLGGALTVAMGSSGMSPDNASFYVITPAVYGAAGMALGALVGTMFRGERWREIDIEDSFLSVGPVPGGGVGVSVRFSVGN